MTRAEFREVARAAGWPEESLGDAFEATWLRFDKNADGLLCIMDLPDNPGTLDGQIFNVIDNVSNR